MFIRTERLFLRPGWPEDLEEVFEALNDDAVQRTIAAPGLPRTNAEVQRLLRRPRNLRYPQFLMYLRSPEGAVLVGGAALVRGEDGDTELVYWIKARFAGRGFAGESVRAMLDQARALGHRRITAYEPLANEADARVLMAAGFEDTYRVEERYCEAQGGFLPVRRFEADLEHSDLVLGHAEPMVHSLTA
ncbi:GNAT family N-acetyltransferase [Novosphingobium sp. YJ-S2-02]|uniref:GNAT family N-acetyltransferase n=1 Tax=Novosphingobium aureum TaxID=2792964 RepID=A0A931H9P5_9SPHN|nr:GNAT family N-acetyltransferase [Novosphingobium aureum]MBH0111754.1 GNAT family N-acetyltransferase [Novosphingobium aureum]